MYARPGEHVGAGVSTMSWMLWHQMVHVKATHPCTAS